MRIDRKRSDARRGRMSGFSLIEIMIVVFVVMVIMAIAVPNVLLAVANIRLRSSAGDLAGLMQQARLMAAKNNPQTPPVYAIRYAVRGGRQIAYIDLDGDSAWSSSVTINGVTMGEPLIEFSGTNSFDNAKTLAYTPRGFPCDYTSPPTCSTPATTYFVYYLTDTRVGPAGWAGVVVTKAGRTKIVTWNGSAWN